ncbi:MAG: hypothetical protein AABY05_02150 [Nanoarchaeota archaeon]
MVGFYKLFSDRAIENPEERKLYSGILIYSIEASKNIVEREKYQEYMKEINN